MNKYIHYLVSLCALTFLMPLCAQSTWSTPVALSQGYYPQVCCDPDGNPIAVWLEGDINTGVLAIYGSIYKDGAWQPYPDQITNAFNLYFSPQLCCDKSGHAIVAWVEIDEYGNPVVYATGYTPGNQSPTNGDPISVGEAGVNIDSFNICCDTSGHAIIIWVQDNGEGSQELMGAGYAPGQPNPVKRSQISDNVNFEDSPALCCDAKNHAIVTWTRQDDTIIYGAGYTPGQTPRIDTIAAPSGASVTAPSICCDTQGHAIIAWTQSISRSQSQIYGRGYTIADPSHDPLPQQISMANENGCVDFSAICCPTPGKAVVVWTQCDTSTTPFNQASIYGTEFTPSITPTFWDLISIAPAGNSFDNMQICCISSSKIIVVWSLINCECSCGDEPRCPPPYTYSINGTEYTPNAVPPSHPQKISLDFLSTQSPILSITCCNCKTFALWDQNSEIEYSFLIAEKQTILDIDQTNQDCKTQTETITVHTCGDPAYLEFQLDNRSQQFGNNVFTNVGNGNHTITVTDPEPYSPPSIFSFTVNIPCPSPAACLPANKLFLAGTYSHGAPIQSVAWSDPTGTIPALAAIGGYKSIACNSAATSISVYALDTTTTKLTQIFADLPTDYVYSVDWCTINGVPYLAVAGCPSGGTSVWIYRYDPNYGMVQVATSAAHNGIVYAVKWLCDKCNNYDLRNLAIGGDSVDGIDIRILQFNAATPSLYQIGSASSESTIYSLDWCKSNNPCVANNCLYLVAGGTIASECNYPVNLYIYAVTCDGIMTLVQSGYYEGATIRSTKWCCLQDAACKNLMYLVVAGDPITAGPYTGKNLLVYYYSPTANLLKPFASHTQQEKVFGVDWLQGCQCKDFVAGSGCLTGACTPNIFVYNIDKAFLPDLGIVTQKHFDDNITSVATIKIGDITYILAGSESNNWTNTTKIDPLCPLPTFGNELALYKGIFCQTTAAVPCKPTPDM